MNRVRFRTRVAIAVCASVVMGATGLTAAEAVPTFSSPHKVAPNFCYDSQTTISSGGERNGFMVCRDQKTGVTTLDYVSASLSAITWSRSKVADVRALLAEADDGKTSYALYESSTKAGVFLATKPHVGAARLHRLTSDEATAQDGALLARNGEWWALWSRPTRETGNTLCYYLYQAKTLDGRQAAHNTKLCGVEPALSFSPTGGPELVYRDHLMQVGGDIELVKWAGSRWLTPRRLNRPGVPGGEPTISVSGQTTWVGWDQQAPRGNFHYRMVVQHRTGSGPWTRTSFSPRLASADSTVDSMPQVSASGASTFLGWTTVTPEGKEIVQVEQHTAKGWSGRKVTDGTKGDAVFGEVADVNGHAYLVIEHSDTTVFTVTRHT